MKGLIFLIKKKKKKATRKWRPCKLVTTVLDNDDCEFVILLRH